ncbi:MAG: hypothetical protein ACE5ID_10715, partial [Acidobacteriota bacterium]
MENDSHLLAYLHRHIVDRGGALAIVAGHFKLILDEQGDDLLPLIGQAPSGAPEVGPDGRQRPCFPIRSFRIATRLMHSFVMRSSVRAWILMLVDDHGPSAAELPRGGQAERGRRARELKRRFYLRPGALPDPLTEILRQEGFSPLDALLPHDDLRRPETDILPRQTVFYSEQSLRERFQANTREELKRHGGAMETLAESRGVPAALLLEGADGMEETTSLMEAGRAACSGEVVQLVLEMVPRYVTDLVFMLPGECLPAVHLAVDAAHYLAGRGSGAPPAVHKVTGMGGSAAD